MVTRFTPWVTSRVPLPAPAASGRIRYLGGLGFKSLQPGSYELRLVATQGQARAEERSVLRVSEPLHRFDPHGNR